jgi:YD repeat-containing protein
VNVNNGNHAVPYQLYLLEMNDPLPLSSFTVSSLNPSQSAVLMDSRYKPRLKFDAYDANSNILQFSKSKDVPASFQYGYDAKLPITEIKNAQNSPGIVEFKLEGFEDLSIANVVDNASQAHSGRKYYNGDYTVSFTKPNTRSYIIEYYYFSSPNWVYIQKPYTGPTMALTEGTRIDNIRIRPADSFMTSYTYHPLYGISSVTDPNGVTTFYEYDTFGRLQLVKDHDRNVLSTYNYHYYKQQ